MEDNLLQGKTVLITGASSGIGKALAVEMAKLGAKVGLISRSEDKLKEIVDEIEANGGTAAYALADVSVPDQIKSAFEALYSVLGDFHALINNAGIVDLKPLNIDDVNSVIDINLKGPIFASILIKDYFKKIGGGQIINTSSIASFSLWDSAPIYSTTKAGLCRFTNVRKQSFEDAKIRVNAILPGFINTPINDPLPKPLLDMMVKTTGIVMLEPEQIVPFYTYFVSDLGKKSDQKNIDIILFWKALNFIKTLPETQSKEWNDLEPLLKEGVDPDVFHHVAINRALLKFLLS